MEKDHLLGVAEEDSDPTPEEALEQQESYIVALVEYLARKNSGLVHMNGGELDIHELTQLVRIKYWKALQRHSIEFHKGYIYSIVQHEIADMIRRWKPTLPYQTNEDGELYMGDMLLTFNEEMANPEEVYIEEECFANTLECVIACIASFPPRQRRVLACLIYEEFDGVPEIQEALERNGIDAAMYHWPESEADKKLLKASHSAARKKAANSLREQVTDMLNRIEHKRWASRKKEAVLVGR